MLKGFHHSLHLWMTKTMIDGGNRLNHICGNFGLRPPQTRRSDLPLEVGENIMKSAVF